MYEKFNPAFLLKNKHIQTIYPSLFKKNLPYQFFIERFTLRDGDFLEAYWYKKHLDANKPLVILFHGLAGSYKSPYILGLMKELNSNGYNSVLMHYRSTSGKINTKPIAYHSGKTDDALEYIQTIQKRFPKTQLFSVGFSLGGNMLLKLLGELQSDSPFLASVAVSPPINLELGSNRIREGLSKYYQSFLLGELKKLLHQKYEIHDMESLLHLKKEDIDKIKTFWEFDELYTAPIHGFHSAKDYYEKASAKNYLRYIQTPTLIIHSLDDPFIPKEVVPKKDEISPAITLEIYKNGGHVGFVDGTLLQPRFFLNSRIPAFFNTFI